MQPTLIASYPVYSPGADTSTLTTPSFTPANGEVIVVKATTWDTGSPLAAPTGGGQTYTARQVVAPGGFKGWSAVYTCTVSGSPAAFSISVANPSAASRHSMVVERWGNAILAATPAVFTITSGSSGDMVAGITTTGDNSVVSWAMVDLNSRDPSGRTYLPLTTVENGLYDGHAGSNSVQYFAYTPLTGIGAYTIGEHVPAGALAWTAAGVEIKGTGSYGSALYTAAPTGEFSDGLAGGNTFSTTCVFDTAGQINAVRVYGVTTIQTARPTITVEVWQCTSLDDGSPAGTRIGSYAIDAAALAPGVWNIVPLPVPVSVDSSHVYRIAYNTTGPSYTATTQLFQNGSIVNGHITGIQTRTAPYSGLFNGAYILGVAAGTYPDLSFQGGGYGVDPVFAQQQSGVTLAANLVAGGTMSAALTSQTTLAAGLVSGGTLAAGMTVEPRLASAMTLGGSLGVSFVVPSGPEDPIASPAARQLLACFTEQLLELPSPPAKIELRAGAEAGPLIGPNIDECCPGLAWVRVAQVYPSWDSFPSQDNTWLPTGPLAYAVVLEMGIAFCMPWADTEGGYESLDPPGTQDWANAHDTLMQQQNLMRRAAACCWPHTTRRAVGGWTPLSVEGGCTGGTLTVTVSVMAPCSDC